MDDPFSAAVAALGRRERSVAEMREWLARRGVGEAEANEVIAWLLETEALDDERFAARYAEDKRELAGWGSERIREALASRGIGAEHAEAAVGDCSEERELERALAALDRRGVAIRDRAEMGRALGYLARRGYPSEVAHEAVKLAARRATRAA